MAMDKVGRHQAVTKAQFHQLLRSWFEKTDDARVGPEDGYQRTPWIHVRDGSNLFALNVDTKRDGVDRYLQLVRTHGADLRWTVVTSQRGKPTAVAYGLDLVKIKGFYLYVIS